VREREREREREKSRLCQASLQEVLVTLRISVDLLVKGHFMHGQKDSLVENPSTVVGMTPK